MAKQLFTAGLIVIKQQQVLLAFSKNKQAWYLPGGKIEAHETAYEAFEREIWEELGLSLDPERVQYYCHISAPAYREAEQIMMEQSCFRYDLTETIHPAAEIEKLKYFSLLAYLKEPVKVKGVIQVFENLEADCYL